MGIVEKDKDCQISWGLAENWARTTGLGCQFSPQNGGWWIRCSWQKMCLVNETGRSLEFREDREENEGVSCRSSGD